MTGYTYNKGYAVVVGNLGNSFEIRNSVRGVGNALDEDGFGVLIDRSCEVLRLVAVDELGIYTQSGHEDLQLVVGSSVQVGG